MKKVIGYLCVVALLCSLWGGGASVSMAEEYRVFRNGQAEEALQELLQERTVMALVYLTDSYRVRQAPDEESRVVAVVPSGQQVQILGVEEDPWGDVWEYVSFYLQEVQYKGYIQRPYLACSDELFLQWEETYDKNPYGAIRVYNMGNRQVYPDIEQFPESYQEALKALKEAHPNWTFVKMNTGLEWETVVENEMVQDRNLIPTSFPSYMWESKYSSEWGRVTRESLEYYLDPRNGLTESRIFQFEQLTYNESYHTQEAMQMFLDNTFMAGEVPKTVLSYSYVFFKIGEELNISPFHLACRVYQEQGRGTSELISGTYEGYEGCYNYFNIGASGSTREEIVTSGLERAKLEKWTDADHPDSGGAYYALHGGAAIIASNYILKGQDTLYLQKFDVDGTANGMYWHQYMQNVCAPSSEAQNIRKIYDNAGSLDNTFVFRIPVYENMPQTACEMPGPSYQIDLPAPDGTESAVVCIDGIEYEAVRTDDCYSVQVSDGDAGTAILYSYNDRNVPVDMHVWELSHDGARYTVTEVPELQNLLSYHGFSIRLTGKSGIRFKTGISEETKAALLSTEGAGGYRLKEYGTLVMNNANRAQYPLVKGGTKVAGGLSYGTEDNGELVDKVYETVSGRQRFTSVLVGLPVAQYQTEFAFRGYAVLEKDGNEVVLYGPTVWRSIYKLAEQLLDLGQYREGSSADLFLKKLISDADAYSRS